MNNSALLAESLQRATIIRLKSDSILTATLSGVFDYIPTATPLPYIATRMDSWGHYSAGMAVRVSHFNSTVQVWSGYDGNAELFTLMQRVELLLCLPAMNLAEGNLISISLRKTELSPPDVTRKRYGIMSYYSVIEHS